jgi:hypothetical protein
MKGPLEVCHYPHGSHRLHLHRLSIITFHSSAGVLHTKGAVISTALCVIGVMRAGLEGREQSQSLGAAILARVEFDPGQTNTT